MADQPAALPPAPLDVRGLAIRALLPVALIGPGVAVGSDGLLALGAVLAAICVLLIASQVVAGKVAVALLLAQMAIAMFALLLPWRRNDWHSIGLVAVAVVVFSVLATMADEDMSLLRSMVRASAGIALLAGVVTLLLPETVRALRTELRKLDTYLSHALAQQVSPSGQTPSAASPTRVGRAPSVPVGPGASQVARGRIPNDAREASPVGISPVATAAAVPPPSPRYFDTSRAARQSVNLECVGDHARVFGVTHALDAIVPSQCETEWVGFLDRCIHLRLPADPAEFMMEWRSGEERRSSDWITTHGWPSATTGRNVTRVKFRGAGETFHVQIDAVACTLP